MSERTTQNRHGSDVGYEREDLGAKPIFKFFIGLALVCAVVCLVLVGVYRYLDARDRAQQPPQNPLVAAKPETRNPSTAQTKGEISKAFPEPRLEDDERGQLSSILLEQERTLNSYGWVDEKAGVVHIPIEQAMKLLAEQGLPTRPQSGERAAAGENGTSAKSGSKRGKSPRGAGEGKQ